jgi:hypothetical protein
VGLDVYIGRNFSVNVTTQGSFADSLHSIDAWVGVGWTFGGPKRK